MGALVARSGRPVATPLVVMPTYNESKSLPRTLARLRAAVPESDVLVVDDNSPDGTGHIANELAAVDAAVHVLHRAGKEGLGAAYIAGFGWGLERGYDVLVEMDADGSHPPEQLPDLLEAVSAGADMVIGSRYVPGGSVVNWPRRRRWLSKGGNRYVQLALRLPVVDATAGYRAYRRDTLTRLDLSGVESQGYCFQIDIARRVIREGMTVVEVPITFTEREVGKSKMSPGIVLEALGRVAAWAARDTLGHHGATSADNLDAG